MYSSILSLFSDKQVDSLNKALENSAFDISDIKNHVQPLLGADLPEVTIQELIDSASDEQLTQFDINVNKVFNVCLSLLTDAVLFEHLRIGFLDVSVDADGALTVGDGSFVITSGRHRLTSFLTLAELLNVSDDAFYSQPIPVLASAYRAEAIVHANGSRAMSPAEKVSISIASLGFDPNDSEALLSGFLAGSVKSGAIGLAFQNLASTLVNTPLQPTTLATIGKSFYTNLTRSESSMKRALTQIDFLNRVLELAAAATDEAINKVGESNVARNATAVGMKLVSLVKAHPEVVAALSALEPVKQPKKATTKKVSSSRKPKAEAPEVMPVTMIDAVDMTPAEISVASEVQAPTAPKSRKNGVAKVS